MRAGTRKAQASRLSRSDHIRARKCPPLGAPLLNHAVANSPFLPPGLPSKMASTAALPSPSSVPPPSPSSFLPNPASSCSPSRRSTPTPTSPAPSRTPSTARTSTGATRLSSRSSPASASASTSSPARNASGRRQSGWAPWRSIPPRRRERFLGRRWSRVSPCSFGDASAARLNAPFLRCDDRSSSFSPAREEVLRCDWPRGPSPFSVRFPRSTADVCANQGTVRRPALDAPVPQRRDLRDHQDLPTRGYPNLPRRPGSRPPPLEVERRGGRREILCCRVSGVASEPLLYFIFSLRSLYALRLSPKNEQPKNVEGGSGVSTLSDKLALRRPIIFLDKYGYMMEELGTKPPDGEEECQLRPFLRA